MNRVFIKLTPSTALPSPFALPQNKRLVAPARAPLRKRSCSRASTTRVSASAAATAAPPSPSSSSSSSSSSPSVTLSTTAVPAPGAAAAAAAAEETRTKTPWWTKHDPVTNIVDVSGVQELLDVFANAEDKLVVVDVYAQWCNACRAVSPKVFALAKDNPDTLVLAKLDFDANKQVARALGVRALPSFAMFRGADGKLDVFSAGPARASLLREKVERYGAPRCLLSGVIGGGNGGGVAEETTGSPELRELLEKQKRERHEQEQ